VRKVFVSIASVLLYRAMMMAVEDGGGGELFVNCPAAVAEEDKKLWLID
jgi:hypothetical protein